MTSDGLLVVKFLFSTIWRLFTSWYIPGTQTTPAAFFLFVAVCGLAFRFLYRIIGLNPDSGLSMTIERIPPVGISNVPARKE